MDHISWDRESSSILCYQFTTTLNFSMSESAGVWCDWIWFTIFFCQLLAAKYPTMPHKSVKFVQDYKSYPATIILYIETRSGWHIILRSHQILNFLISFKNYQISHQQTWILIHTIKRQPQNLSLCIWPI